MVVDLARLFGWKVYFSWTSIHSPKGFPDLVMVRLSRIVFAELKSEKGRVTETQREWLDALELSGKVEVYVWKPADWSEIESILR
jgi:hypothetical protein